MLFMLALVVVTAVAVLTFVGAMAAHCLSRYKFTGNRLIYFLIFSAIIFPPQIELIEAQNPDLVVLDVQMPGMEDRKSVV